MPLTRAQCDQMALARTQGILSETLGPTIIPPVGTVPDSPVAWLGFAVTSALAECGIVAADPMNPTDAECALVPDHQRGRLADCLEYYALSAGVNQYLAESVSVGSVSVSGSNTGNRLQALVKLKADQLKARYGIGTFQAGGLAVGSLPPYLARPNIPQSQNWPDPRFGRRPWR